MWRRSRCCRDEGLGTRDEKFFGPLLQRGRCAGGLRVGSRAGRGAWWSMTEFFTVKRIDNSRLRRQAAPNRFRECARVLALGGVVAAGGLLYAWQHFQNIQLGYQLEELKAERAQALELNQQLRLETAALSSP